eukprot:scaffold3062_cov154-Cylindrotheca_fusiformis.AAC.1
MNGATLRILGTSDVPEEIWVVGEHVHCRGRVQQNPLVVGVDDIPSLGPIPLWVSLSDEDSGHHHAFVGLLLRLQIVLEGVDKDNWKKLK